jgi:hypothetical protein
MNPAAGRIDATIGKSAPLCDHIAPRRGSHFLLTFCWLGQKVRRRAGARPRGLVVGLSTDYRVRSLIVHKFRGLVAIR